MRASRVETAIAELRERHPELRTRPSWPALLNVLRRDGIRLRRAKIPSYGRLVGYLGEWTILIGVHAPRALWSYVVLHELGHLVLHHERGAERWEPCLSFGYDVDVDEREDDAELFAAIIMNPEIRK
jgi:hypothetical protein